MSQDNNILSISELDLESPQNWKIVAKVDNLSPIIPDGPTGRYFYVDLSDTTGKIRGIAYRSAADRLHKKLEENSVYSIEKGVIHRVKPESKKNNEYAITFKEYSNIIQMDEDELSNNVAKHGKLLSKEKDSSVVSQSQYNALLEYRSPKSLARGKVFEICKRLKEIKKEELALAMEKLKLKNERDSILK